MGDTRRFRRSKFRDTVEEFQYSLSQTQVDECVHEPFRFQFFLNVLVCKAEVNATDRDTEAFQESKITSWELRRQEADWLGITILLLLCSHRRTFMSMQSTSSPRQADFHDRSGDIRTTRNFNHG